LLNLTKLLYTWNILLSILIAIVIAIAIAKAQTPLFSLLVSKMSILDNFLYFRSNLFNRQIRQEWPCAYVHTCVFGYFGHQQNHQKVTEDTI
jgi:hypothetical protein